MDVSGRVLIGRLLALVAGNWKADKALKLETTQETYPVWEVTALVYTGFALEYKYVIARGGGELQWENGPVNRRLGPIFPCAQHATEGTSRCSTELKI